MSRERSAGPVLDRARVRGHAPQRMAVPASRRAKRAKAAAAAPLDDVRGRVLNAAVKIIDRDGLAGVSMREVARAAGISHQAPYHYFEDREGILAALAEEGFKILLLRIQPIVDAKEAAVDRFVRAGQAYVEFALDHPALFRVMFRPDMVKLHDFPEADACGHRAFELVPRLVQACIDEGLPAYPSVDALVLLMWSIPHGVACLMLDGPLAHSLPAANDAREEATRDMMTAMRAILVSRSAAAAATKPASRAKSTKPPRARRLS